MPILRARAIKGYTKMPYLQFQVSAYKWNNKYGIK